MKKTNRFITLILLCVLFFVPSLPKPNAYNDLKNKISNDEALMAYASDMYPRSVAIVLTRQKDDLLGYDTDITDADIQAATLTGPFPVFGLRHIRSSIMEKSNDTLTKILKHDMWGFLVWINGDPVSFFWLTLEDNGAYQLMFENMKKEFAVAVNKSILQLNEKNHGKLFLLYFAGNQIYMINHDNYVSLVNPDATMDYPVKTYSNLSLAAARTFDYSAQHPGIRAESPLTEYLYKSKSSVWPVIAGISALFGLWFIMKKRLCPLQYNK